MADDIRFNAICFNLSGYISCLLRRNKAWLNGYFTGADLRAEAILIIWKVFRSHRDKEMGDIEAICRESLKNHLNNKRVFYNQRNYYEVGIEEEFHIRSQDNPLLTLLAQEKIVRVVNRLLGFSDLHLPFFLEMLFPSIGMIEKLHQWTENRYSREFVPSVIPATVFADYFEVGHNKAKAIVRDIKREILNL